MGESAVAAAIVTGPWPHFEQRLVPGPQGPLNIRIGGAAEAPAIVANHAILTGSAIWYGQAQALAATGYRVICIDSRGHGGSPASPAPYTIDDLAADTIAVLDALGIARAHYLGVSLGGMTGLGLALAYPERLFSLCICAARADAPTPFAAQWDERIDLVRRQGVAALAQVTAERWFGADFLNAHDHVARQLIACIEQTSSEGFIGCARAIQGLAYVPVLDRIRTPMTLVVGASDTGMVAAMQALQPLLHGAPLTIIPDAGHLPQIDQPEIFNLHLLDHLRRHGAQP